MPEMDQIILLLLCFAYPGQYPENIPDQQSGMSKLKKLLISGYVRNGLNQQVNNFYCLSGLVSGKYYGLQIWNVQTEKSYWWILKKISVMLHFGYYESAPFQMATEAQCRQAFIFLMQCNTCRKLVHGSWDIFKLKQVP